MVQAVLLRTIKHLGNDKAGKRPLFYFTGAKAQELGIPIWDESQFLAELKKAGIE